VLELIHSVVGSCPTNELLLSTTDPRGHAVLELQETGGPRPPVVILISFLHVHSVILAFTLHRESILELCNVNSECQR